MSLKLEQWHHQEPAFGTTVNLAVDKVITLLIQGGGGSWRKHGEAQALKLVLQYLWMLWLDEQGWGPEQCPVKGVFAEGEVYDDSDAEAA